MLCFLLLLDGYYALEAFTKAGAELLFEVVSRAYERQSLVVTTNLPFQQWPEVCGSERLTGAMLDRLAGPAPRPEGAAGGSVGSVLKGGAVPVDELIGLRSGDSKVSESTSGCGPDQDSGRRLRAAALLTDQHTA